MNTNKTPILTTEAFLWNGKKQLAGILTLTPRKLHFQFDDFRQSHLGLKISISEIKKVEEFLVFDLARNGIRIESKSGKADLFVLKDSAYLGRYLNMLLGNESTLRRVG